MRNNKLESRKLYAKTKTFIQELKLVVQNTTILIQRLEKMILIILITWRNILVKRAKKNMKIL